jgi:pimeloyl-ACP methyl ester carboxylesterase
VDPSAAGRSPKRERSVRRFLRRWLLFLGGGYLLVCLVMWLIENRLVYFPTRAEELWNPPPVAAIQDVNYTSPGGTEIHAWWLPATPDAPVLVLFPGNAGNLSGRGETIVRMRERLGTSVLIFDYPGYGKSSGKPNEAACYDAAEGALQWLRDEKEIASERVILYGESLGGGVATEMATRHPCRALVLVKTFTSLPAAAKRHYPWLPCHWLMSNRFDNLSKLADVRCPVFVVGATADRVIPYEQAEALNKAANEPKHLFRDAGSDHNDPLPDEVWDELRAFLARTDNHPN